MANSPSAAQLKLNAFSGRVANFPGIRVYVIGAKTGPVKIGMAAEPNLRLLTLQIGYPFRLEVLTELAGGEQEEAILHELFRKERLHGEWFKRSKRLRHFVNMANCNVSLAFIIARLDPYGKTRASEMYRRSCEN